MTDKKREVYIKLRINFGCHTKYAHSMLSFVWLFYKNTINS